MATPTWKWKQGVDRVQETPESPEIDTRGGRRVYNRTFLGEYAALQDRQPTEGQRVEDLPGRCVVTSFVLSKLIGGRGRLRVSAEDMDYASSVREREESQPQYEIEWVQLEKPIEQHPRYGTGGASELSDEDRAAVDAWRNEPNVAARKDRKYRTTPESDPDATLSENAQNLADKIAKGVDTYLVFYPVVRRTRTTNIPSTASDINTQILAKNLRAKLRYVDIPITLWVERSSAWKEVDLYYLKTADRCTRTGNRGAWERIEEWTGAETWDPDLYHMTTEVAP